MQINALVLATGLLVASCAFAQSGADNAMATSAPQNLGVHTVEGCLSTTNGMYAITGGGLGPKQYRIVAGDTSALKGKVLYTVAVTGPVGTNDASENVNSPYNEGTTTGVGWNTIVAQQVKIIHANCSEPGKEN